MDMAPDPALKAGLGTPLEDAGTVTRRARWTDLANHAAEANSFYAPAMLDAALDHLVAGIGVHLIEVYDGPMLIGLMPVALARRHGRAPVANVVNWMHRHCFFGAPLIRRGHETAAWTGFLAQLDAASWAPGFLHLSGIDAAGANAAAIEAACTRDGRRIVELHRYDRALLRSEEDADAYWDTNVRPKKRKEIRRLQKRLAELGTVSSRILTDPADLPGWIDAFLALEASGWKGGEGTALGCNPADAAFFRAAATAALAADQLHMLRLDLDGRPIAMLANFRHLDGAFSFKIAIDETLGRFSPGVLIEIDNLRAVLSDPAIGWMDSCAAAGHPMIDSLWGERRSIVQYRIALRGSGLHGLRRDAAFAFTGAADRLAAIVKGS